KQTKPKTATDASGNTSSVSRTVTWNADSIAPVITATGTTLNLTTCNPSVSAIDSALGTATATDNCGPVTANPTTGTITAQGCTRTQTRTWTATDACGNTSSVSRTVTWNADSIAPVITATGTTLNLTSCNPSVSAIDSALGTATATDNCGP